MSEEVKKITEEELKRVLDNNAKLGKILQDIGIYESEKHALLHLLAELNKDKPKGYKKKIDTKLNQIRNRMKNMRNDLVLKLQKFNSKKDF